MALRNIREIGEDILEKKAKEVTDFSERIKELTKDMLETMYESGGVGLAAPQIGVLKRVIVIDTTEDGSDPHILINPKILEETGEQFGWEGCLSVPGKSGRVRRPQYVRVEACDADGNRIELEGTDLLARALCHEIDHLEGRLYVDRVEGELIDSDKIEEYEAAEEEGA
ncbi:MAG: peptide deformylase [Lachnospiraceae bacterium]|nr:peptide deformylase [Lachnospiraceae bacterium]